MLKTQCDHAFHKTCLTKYLRNNPDCPICGTKLVSEKTADTPKSDTRHPYDTRSQIGPPAEQKSDNTVTKPKQIVQQSATNTAQVDNLQNMVTAAVGAQQAEMLQSLDRSINRIIETQMEDGFRRFSLQYPPQQNRQQPLLSNINTLPNVEQQTLNQLLGLPPESVPNTLPSAFDHAPNRSSSRHTSNELAFRPDKVGHIITNWKLRFTGAIDGMPVENFIYRVEALTNQTLGGCFDTVCRHASLLFDSKASDWFWRYHKSVSEIRWPSLCEALRRQYKDTRTDVDYREKIRDRKQKANESFDSFYDSIVQLTDRLNQPIPESTLVEIIRRNLLPEIQYEILNIQVFSIAHLRDICRKREFFLQDMQTRQNYGKPLPIRKRVSEVQANFDFATDEDASEYEDVEEVALVCWNCKRNGHRYQDCVSERRVFCYGCGTADVYKPNCPRCNVSKNGQSSALKSARRQTPLKNLTHQATNTD